jgi:hypothetical protein
MTRADELRADLRQRKSRAESAFHKFKFGGLVKDVETMSLAVADTSDVASPAIPGIPGSGRRL